MSVLEVGDVCSAATLGVDVAMALQDPGTPCTHSIVIDSQLHLIALEPNGSLTFAQNSPDDIKYTNRLRI